MTYFGDIWISVKNTQDSDIANSDNQKKTSTPEKP